MKTTPIFPMVIALLASLTTACTYQNLDRGLPTLLGKKLDVAVDVLGIPNEHIAVGDFTVYAWTNSYSRTVPFFTTPTAMTTGTVGATPVYGTTTTGHTNFVTSNQWCQIRLKVDGENVITQWNYDGDEMGCQYFAMKVKPLIPTSATK